MHGQSKMIGGSGKRTIHHCFIRIHRMWEELSGQVSCGETKEPFTGTEWGAGWQRECQVAPVLAEREEPTRVKFDANTLGSKSSMLFYTLDTMKKGSLVFHKRTSRGGWTFVNLELLWLWLQTAKQGFKKQWKIKGLKQYSSALIHMLGAIPIKALLGFPPKHSSFPPKSFPCYNLK